MEIYSLKEGKNIDNLELDELITDFTVGPDGMILWGIERSGFFNGREKWAKGFENQRV